jgi:hypothetical protein
VRSGESLEILVAARRTEKGGRGGGEGRTWRFLLPRDRMGGGSCGRSASFAGCPFSGSGLARLLCSRSRSLPLSSRSVPADTHGRVAAVSHK